MYEWFCEELHLLLPIQVLQPVGTYESKSSGLRAWPCARTEAYYILAITITEMMLLLYQYYCYC